MSSYVVRPIVSIGTGFLSIFHSSPTELPKPWVKEEILDEDIPLRTECSLCIAHIFLREEEASLMVTEPDADLRVQQKFIRIYVIAGFL